MAECFRLLVFPAQRGDAILVEYGDSASPHRILIDGGITRTARDYLRSHLVGLGEGTILDAVVVTHIDQDHIQGIVMLLEDLPPNITIECVLFNGQKHLPIQPFGVADALRLTEILDERHAAAWKAGTDAAIRVELDGTPRPMSLPGGMQLTILSPTESKLKDLALEWVEVMGSLQETDEQIEAVAVAEQPGIEGLEILGALDVAALAKSKFDEDDTAPNGSSIAFLMEYGGKRALMLADAHPSVIVAGLRCLSPHAPLAVDCVKLAHHGSRRNTNLALVQQVSSPLWIISSNGAQTRHPNTEAIARVLQSPSEGRKTLYFNYSTPFNDMWANQDMGNEHGYDAVYGDGVSPQSIDLLPVPAEEP